MPITSNEQTKTVFFDGSGDVLVGTAHYEHEPTRENVLIFKECEPSPIGMEHVESEKDVQVVIIFTKPESVDVMLELLLRIRGNLINAKGHAFL